MLIDDMTNSSGTTETSKPGCDKPVAIVTASRSARRGLHAADGGTSSHFLRSSPAVKLVKPGTMGAQENCTGAALGQLTGSADYHYCDIATTDASQHPSSAVGEMWPPKLPAKTIRTGHPIV